MPIRRHYRGRDCEPRARYAAVSPLIADASRATVERRLSMCREQQAERQRIADFYARQTQQQEERENREAREGFAEGQRKMR
jgi:hypothetical protein